MKLSMQKMYVWNLKHKLELRTSGLRQTSDVTQWKSPWLWWREEKQEFCNRNEIRRNNRNPASVSLSPPAGSLYSLVRTKEPTHHTALANLFEESWPIPKRLSVVHWTLNAASMTKNRTMWFSRRRKGRQDKCTLDVASICREYSELYNIDYLDLFGWHAFRHFYEMVWSWMLCTRYLSMQYNLLHVDMPGISTLSWSFVLVASFLTASLMLVVSRRRGRSNSYFDAVEHRSHTINHQDWIILNDMWYLCVYMIYVWLKKLFSFHIAVLQMEVLRFHVNLDINSSFASPLWVVEAVCQVVAAILMQQIIRAVYYMHQNNAMTTGCLWFYGCLKSEALKLEVAATSLGDFEFFVDLRRILFRMFFVTSHQPLNSPLLESCLITVSQLNGSSSCPSLSPSAET